MKANVTTASQSPTIVLNRAKLDELRRANGIETERDLARVLNVDTATLYRVTTGKTLPSNGFIARAKIAFPHVKFEDLFSIQEVAA